MAYEQYPRPVCMALLNVLNSDEVVERFLKLCHLFDVTLRHLSTIAIAQLQHDFGTPHPELDCRPTPENQFHLLCETVRLYKATQRESFVCPELLETFWRGQRCKPFTRMGALIDSEIGQRNGPSRGRYSIQRFFRKMLELRQRTWARGAVGLSKTRCEMLNRYLVPAMEALLDRLQFICQYPLVAVESVTRSDTGSYVHRLRQFMGPFAQADHSTWQSDAAGRKPKGRLYLARCDGARCVPVLSLFPWAILHQPPEAPEVPPEVLYLTQDSDRAEYVGHHSGRVLSVPGINRWARAYQDSSCDGDRAEASESLFQGDQLDGRRFSQSAWDVLKGSAGEAGRMGWHQQRTVHLLQSLSGQLHGRLPFALALQQISASQLLVTTRALTGGRFPLCADRLPLCGRFMTPSLRRVLASAESLAGGTLIDEHHLILALLTTPQNDAAAVLDILGIDQQQILRHLQQQSAALEESRPLPTTTVCRMFGADGHVIRETLSPELERVFHLALAESRRWGASAIRTGALFVALTRVPGAATQQILLDHLPESHQADDAEGVLQRLREQLRPTTPPGPEDLPALRMHQDSFSINAQLMLARAEALAEQDSGSCVSDRHLLLALLCYDGSIQQGLEAIGFDTSALAQAVVADRGMAAPLSFGYTNSLTGAAQQEMGGGPVGPGPSLPGHASMEECAGMEPLFIPNGFVTAELFTTDAYASLKLSLKAAEATRWDTVRTPHIFMGLATRDDGLADALFAKTRHGAKDIYRAFSRAFMQRPGAEGPLQLHREFFSDNVIRLLHRARARTAEHQETQISEKHLMMAILEDVDGIVVYTLSQVGLDAERLRELCEPIDT